MTDLTLPGSIPGLLRKQSVGEWRGPTGVQGDWDNESPEVWCLTDIVGYEVSNMGRVRSVDRELTYASRRDGTHGHTRIVTGRELVPQRGPYGHCFVTLCDQDGKHRRKVHQLVIDAFGPPGFDGAIIRHLDGDAGNNDAGNLAWGTYKDNERDKRRHGRVYQGERNHKSKMSAGQIPMVRAVFDSGRCKQREAATYFGLSQKSYADIGRRRTWKHVPESPVDAEALRRVCLHVAGLS